MSRHAIALLSLLAACSFSGDAKHSGGIEADDTDYLESDDWSDGAYDTDDASPMDTGNSGGSLGVGQGGAQDFGQFKQILLDGGIPGPDTIDDVGFFNEHRIEFPQADCGEDVCLHGRFGTLGNMLNGGDCTIVLLGLNTPIDPSEMVRPPLNLAIAVDTSGSMAGQPMAYLRQGLTRMLDELHSEDRVSIITFSTRATVLVDHVTGDDPALAAAIDGLAAGGSTNIHDGLSLALATVDSYADTTTQNRVMLLSDGEATAGNTDPGAIMGVAGTYADQGYSTTTIGMGDSFDVGLMRGLSEIGAGAFYFLQDEAAVEEVFAEELSYFLVPLAEQVAIDVNASSAFNLRNVYGTRLFSLGTHTATIDIPNLQIAHRTSASDQGPEGGNRRGGGGALIVELLPRSGNTGGEAAEIDFSYTSPTTGERIEQSITIETPFADPLSPPDGFFDDSQVEKSFVMLNIYVGFRAAATSASLDEYGEALSTLQALDSSLTEWLLTTDDDDIEDDLTYVRQFITNLENTNAEPEPRFETGEWLWD